MTIPYEGQNDETPLTQMLPLSLLSLAFHLVHLSLGFPGQLLGLALALALYFFGL